MPHDIRQRRVGADIASTLALASAIVLAFGALPSRAETGTGRVAKPVEIEAAPKSEPQPPVPTPPALEVKGPAAAADASPMTIEQFLDRLMIAESGGRLFAKNPRSTALGPFQFIESTFLSVARRHFAAETATLAPDKILALRTDLAFARRAAEAYTRDNAALLKGQDIEPTFPHLRLAFLLGPGGAAKVIKAPPDAFLSALLGPAVLIANPFMVTMTARGLIARTAHEVLQPVGTSQGVEVPPGAVVRRGGVAPGIAVRCNLRLPSCKRWLSLQTAKVRGKKGGKIVVATAVGAKAAVPPPAGLGAVKVRRKR